jgi:arabinogalactan oligomer/maltooligosaccharide transport system permease protein
LSGVALFLTACLPGPTVTNSQRLQGRILMWHTWGEFETEALQGVITRFSAIHPGVQVRHQRFATLAEMLVAFENAADSGLGPDLVSAPGGSVPALAGLGLIDPLNGLLPDAVLVRYTNYILETLRYNGLLYGLPEALNPLVLYYNRDLVSAPPTTLEALLAEATEGRVVVMGVSFYDAYWGVQAFGGRLLDEDGRIALDQGGFADWLAWLRRSREAPGMILDANREVLRNRFITDGVAYYVGEAAEFNLLVDALGADRVGVALLPAGPAGAAGPFLTVQGLLFSTVSSPNQRQLALEFATFLTNTEQSATLMRTARRAPANLRVRINPRLNPNIANIVTQARMAVPMRLIPEVTAAVAVGDETYMRVLEGVVEPDAAALELTQAIEEQIGPAESAVPATVLVPAPGQVGSGGAHD